MYNYLRIENFMHELGAPILDKLTTAVTVLQTCKFEVQTSPEETNLLCAFTSTKTLNSAKTMSICSIFILKCEESNASS